MIKYKYIHLIIIAVVIVFVLSGCGRGSGEVVSEQVSRGPAPQTQSSPVTAVVAADHVRGPAEAPVTIITYSDFECPFCARFAAANGSLERAREEFGDSIRFVFRHYPLPFHAAALVAAQAAECAAEQGAFWEMHDRLFAAAADNKLYAGQYGQDAHELGMDAAAFGECLADGRVAGAITEAFNEAEKAGVRSAPTSFVNGRIIVGALAYEDYETAYGVEQGLRSIISEALAATK